MFISKGGVSMIISPDPPTAGESYTLECSIGGSEGTFQWLGPPDGRTLVVESRPRLIIIADATSSQLQFMPIRQSDNGSYSCSATTNGLTWTSEPVMININGIIIPFIINFYYIIMLCFYFPAPSVSVQISGSVVTPTAGEDYQLTCRVSGDENLNPTTAYRWTKNSDSGQIQVGTSSTLSFTPLRLSDAASYVCEVTISSSYLTGDIVAINVNPQDVRIQCEFTSRL